MDAYEVILEAVASGVELVQAVLGFLMSLAVYILQGVALYRMAKKLEIDSPWLAFVPIANVWMLGKIADANEVTPKHAKRLLISSVILLIPLAGVMGVVVGALLSGNETLCAAAIALMIAFCVIVFVTAIVYSVFTYIAYYRICQNFAPEQTTGYFLGILLGDMCCSSMIPLILLLILSGKEPMSGRKITYTAPFGSEHQH